MSVEVRSGEESKRLETVVGLDPVLDFSTVVSCSLNLSSKRLLVSPSYCKLRRLHRIMLYMKFLEGIFRSGQLKYYWP